MYVIGVDPGPVTGLFGLVLDSTRIVEVQAVQCSAGCVLNVLGGLSGHATVLIAVEGFVVGFRAARANQPEAGRQARAVADRIAEWAQHRANRIERRAVDVKA